MVISREASLPGFPETRVSTGPQGGDETLRLYSQQQFQKSLFSFKTEYIERPAGQWVWGQSRGKSCGHWACRVGITGGAVPVGAWPDLGQRAALRPLGLVHPQPRAAEAESPGLPVGSTHPMPGLHSTHWGSHPTPALNPGRENSEVGPVS